MGINGKDKTISQFFDYESQFTIPLFQRSYDWGEEEVKTWLNDINEIDIQRNNKYFVGGIVFSKSEESNQFIIIDGQQRLTTSYLIYFHIDKIYNDNRGTTENRTLKNELAKKIDVEFEQDIYVQKVKLNKIDQVYFDSLISGNESVIIHESHEKINKAYNDVQDFCKKAFDENGFDGLVKIVKSLKAFICMAVEVGDDIDAYQLFESMNDKGRDLSKSDLIKNYVFNKVNPAHHDLMETKWEEILLHIRKAKYAFDNYLMYYLDGKYGNDIRANQIFTEFKEKYPTSDSIKQSISDVHNMSINIDYFFNPDDFDTFSNLNDTNKSNLIEVLNQLKVLPNTQYHIIVIPLFSYFDDNNMAETSINYLRHIRNTLIKYIVCKKQTNVLLPIFCSESKKIYDGKDFDEEKFKENLNLHSPEELEFKQNFHKFKSTNSLSKMIFKSIFKTPNGLTYDNNKIQLEHVIPMKWKEADDWKQYFSTRNETFNKDLEDIEKRSLLDYVNPLLYRIGDHCLLYNEDNNALKNHFYNTIKRPKYLESRIGDTRELGESYLEFNEEAIYERETNICQKLIDEWGLYND